MTNDPTTAGPLGEAGARLRALVAKWRELADFAEKHLAFNIKNDNIDDDAQIRALRDCAAELDALLSAPVVSGWQPIETAPKDDGQDLILVDADGLVGHGFFDRSNLVWRWLDDALVNQPTHWMHFPAAPVVTQEGEEPCP